MQARPLPRIGGSEMDWRDSWWEDFQWKAVLWGHSPRRGGVVQGDEHTLTWKCLQNYHFRLTLLQTNGEHHKVQRKDPFYLWSPKNIKFKVCFRFQEALLKYGVNENDIFQTNDLSEKRDLATVTNTIYAMAREVTK